MIRALIFDLDDTLYLEEEFFRSGFAHVGSLLQARGIGDAARLGKMLMAIHVTEGRERVFDKAAERCGFPQEWVPDLVAAFRSHAPEIRLAPDVLPTFERLRCRYKLGCITDGWADVQRRKLAALRLAEHFDAIVVADDGGRQNWKPAAAPFLTCCARLAVGPEEAVYVGDHPERDVQGACNAGIRCIRIRRERGYFRDVPALHAPADFEIVSLLDLPPILDQLDGSEEPR